MEFLEGFVAGFLVSPLIMIVLVFLFNGPIVRILDWAFDMVSRLPWNKGY